MTLRVDIMRAEVCDIGAIAELEEKYIPNGWSEKGFADSMKNETYAVFKAVVGSSIAGFANIQWAADEGELLNIAVSEKYRRNGIGGQLLSAVYEAFRERGVTAVFLEVREKNAAAIGFYKAQGFETAGLRRNYYQEPSDDAVIMKKKL